MLLLGAEPSSARMDIHTGRGAGVTVIELTPRSCSFLDEERSTWSLPADPSPPEQFSGSAAGNGRLGPPDTDPGKTPSLKESFKTFQNF